MSAHESSGSQGVDDLTWRPLAADDLPLLASWLAEPQVVRWWNHEFSTAAVERDFGPSVRGEEAGEDLVVLLGGRPVGLVQRSRVRDYPTDLDDFSTLLDVPLGAVTLDYLIADAAMRGQGLGARMLATAVARTWTDYPDASAMIVAVVAANVASWRALEKAGLRRVATGDLTPDNPVDDPLHYVYQVDRPYRTDEMLGTDDPRETDGESGRTDSGSGRSNSQVTGDRLGRLQARSSSED